MSAAKCAKWQVQPTMKHFGYFSRTLDFTKFLFPMFEFVLSSPTPTTLFQSNPSYVKELSIASNKVLAFEQCSPEVAHKWQNLYSTHLLLLMSKIKAHNTFIFLTAVSLVPSFTRENGLSIMSSPNEDFKAGFIDPFRIQVDFFRLHLNFFAVLESKTSWHRGETNALP